MNLPLIEQNQWHDAIYSIVLSLIQILKLLRGEKDGEEWFKMHVKELKERGKREDDEFDLQLISKPLLDVEDYITSHNCAAEQRKHFTLEEYLKG